MVIFNRFSAVNSPCLLTITGLLGKPQRFQRDINTVHWSASCSLKTVILFQSQIPNQSFLVSCTFRNFWQFSNNNTANGADHKAQRLSCNSNTVHWLAGCWWHIIIRGWTERVEKQKGLLVYIALYSLQSMCGPLFQVSRWAVWLDIPRKFSKITIQNLDFWSF